jgi:hypothetical protein
MKTVAGDPNVVYDAKLHVRGNTGGKSVPDGHAVSNREELVGVPPAPDPSTVNSCNPTSSRCKRARNPGARPTDVARRAL